MKTLFVLLSCFVTIFPFVVQGQVASVPTAVAIEIVKAEDARKYDAVEKFLGSTSNEKTLVRALLATGRIGDERSLARVSSFLNNRSAGVREMAAFALGEIESVKAAETVVAALGKSTDTPRVTSRLVEAAGKIAAANPTDEKSSDLREAILDVLEAEEKKGPKQDRETILLGLTAALRAAPRDAKRERPDDTDIVVAKFLTNLNPRVRSDAANTLTRVRAKNANVILRAMLLSDDDAIARANAARALAAAEDKTAVDILITAAAEDADSRVRVSAIRALATLRDAKAADALLKRGDALLAAYKRSKKPNFLPDEHSEFLEIAAALGRLLTNTRDGRAVNMFREFGKLDRGFSPEVYIARLRVAPGRGDEDKPELTNWRQYSTLAQVVGEFATLEPTNEEGKRMKGEAPDILRPLAKAYAEADPVKDADTIKAAPDVLRAYAAFKTSDLGEVLRIALRNKDVFVRATAADLMGDLPASKDNLDALTAAFAASLQTDKHDNDAQLALLDTLFKLDKRASVRPISEALVYTDFLVRKKALDLLKDKSAWKDVPPGETDNLFKSAVTGKDGVWAYDPKSSTRLGQVLNIDADYRRAIGRKNWSVAAIVTTQKGTFTIDLLPEDAPLTVDNFIKLARANYFNGLEVHRVVPNFVMQDGDPRGDGNGGPGWSIRCEMNMLPYERGAVGMALSGKDTGGSQWFVTHSPQPHLDGGYTVFGRVNEKDMRVVDRIVRGDRIVTVRIREVATQRSRRTRRK